MLNLLIKPLLGVAGDVVKNVAATRKVKAEQKITEIKAKTSLMEKQIKGEMDWDIVPDWYFWTWGAIVSASYGIKGATKFFKK